MFGEILGKLHFSSGNNQTLIKVITCSEFALHSLLEGLKIRNLIKKNSILTRIATLSTSSHLSIFVIFFPCTLKLAL